MEIAALAGISGIYRGVFLPDGKIWVENELTYRPDGAQAIWCCIFLPIYRPDGA